MTSQALARRYAGALFDVAAKAGTLEPVGRDLTAFRDLVTGHDQLRTIFTTPGVSATKKRAVVDAMLGAAGPMTAEVPRLLRLLADRDRLALVADITAAFNERAQSARRVLPAQIVTAAPLDAAQQAAIATALGRAVGGEVRLDARVDPSIIGGMIARVGGVVYDASLTRQLEKMRQRLLEER